MNTQLSVKIIGNPVHQNLQFQISGTGGKALPVWVADKLGKRYKTIMAADGSKQINMEDLSSGMYYLMYQSNGNTFSTPFAKQ